jgi:benzodiazapine receptor
MPKKVVSSSFTLTDLWHVLLAIFVSQLAGILGSFFTFSEITNWYAFLEKPFFTPPNWLFGPVWIMLYTLMGIALFLSCRYGKPAAVATRASYWFYAQLIFNALWSIVFFGLHSLWGGFFTIIILWLLIFKTIQMFSLVNKTAAWLLIPYILWVSYATALNLALAWLN